MNGTPEPAAANTPLIDTPIIKLFGVGTAGIAVVEDLIARGLAGVEYIAVSAEAPSKSSASVRLHIENKLLRGMGSGGDPDRSRIAAEEWSAKFKSLCEGASAVLIAAGLGGGSGTGISPVIARAAHDAGALVLGFVAMPFDCEGKRRQAVARTGLEQLKAIADGVICLPNQKIFKLIDENTSVLETFNITNRLLADGIQGVWRLLTNKGMIEIQVQDLCALVRGSHAQSFFATAEAAGSIRSREVVEKLLAHPMLDGGGLLAETEAVLVSLVAGSALTMAEVNWIMQEIQTRCDQAELIMGAALEESLGDRLAVTLIASQKSEAAEEEPARATGEIEELHKQLLPPSSDRARSNSRFVAPPPDLPQEKMQQMLTRQSREATAKKRAAKMRQTQLPLEIISKGRFDKSEPTIHRGEDLDVPTYIRRGVALN